MTLRHTLLLATLLSLVSTSSTRASATLHVPSEYGSIGAAVAAARSGDEIVLAGGFYYEDVLIQNKPGLNIRTESSLPPELYSLTVSDSPGFWVDNLKFTARPGLEQQLTISRSWDSHVRGCTFSDTDKGIVISFSPEVTVRNCRFYGNRWGVELTSSANSWIKGCEFFNFVGSPGVSIASSRFVEVSSNEFVGSAPLKARACDNLLVRDNTFRGDRLEVENCSNGTISRNRFSGDGSEETAISVRSCVGFKVTKNRVKRYRDGIAVTNGGSHELFKNKVDRNSEHGLKLMSTDGNTIRRNKGKRNGYWDAWDSNPETNTYSRNRFRRTNVR